MDLLKKNVIEKTSCGIELVYDEEGRLWIDAKNLNIYVKQRKEEFSGVGCGPNLHGTPARKTGKGKRISEFYRKRGRSTPVT